MSDCPICQRGRPLDVIKDGETVWITAGPEAPLPGYVCVVAKRHVDEPFDLPDNDRAQFWEETMAVAKALAGLLGPKKMNYEIHGNTIPHLHMHLFPRTAGDVYVGYVIHHRVEFEQSAKDLEDLKTGIVARLREAKRLA